MFGKKVNSNYNANNNGELTAYDFGKIGVTETSHRPEISLWLDSYSDLFSDFDPRPYSQRALSHDFLEELRRATFEIGMESFKLSLLIPTTLRKTTEENIIKRRLNDHFNKHAALQNKERRKVVLSGFGMIFFGVLLMAGATIIFHNYRENWIYSLLMVLLEPAGWFMVWEGMYLAIFVNRSQRPELIFYQKVSAAEVKFGSY